MRTPLLFNLPAINSTSILGPTTNETSKLSFISSEYARLVNSSNPKMLRRTSWVLVQKTSFMMALDYIHSGNLAILKLLAVQVSALSRLES